MKALCLIGIALLGAGFAATPGAWGSPPQAFGLSGTVGEINRLRWQQSFIQRAPTQLLLLVSVTYPGEWASVSTNFYVNKRGAMNRWVDTPRDRRGSGERQLSENVMRNLKQLVPKLPVPMPRPGRTRVVVSFVDEGQWVTCVYSAEALPETLGKIFQVLDFNDYGSQPQHF